MFELLAIYLFVAAADDVFGAAGEGVDGLPIDLAFYHQVAGAVEAVGGKSFQVAFGGVVVAAQRVGAAAGEFTRFVEADFAVGAGLHEADFIARGDGAADAGVDDLVRVGGFGVHVQPLGHAEHGVGGAVEFFAEDAGAIGAPEGADAGDAGVAFIEHGFQAGQQGADEADEGGAVGVENFAPGGGGHVARDGEGGAGDEGGAEEADHAGVVDHRHGHEERVGGAVAEPLGGALHVEEVVVGHARDDFGDAGGAAGELEDAGLEGVAGEFAHGMVGGGGVLGCGEVFQAGDARAGLAAQGNDVAHAGDFRAHGLGKVDQVEFWVVVVHDVGAGFGMIAEVGDFALAVGGECADGDESGFEAADQRVDEFFRVAALEEYAVERLQAE